MSLFKKLIKSLTSKGNLDDDDAMTSNKYLPKEDMPVDEKFMLNFRQNGGKFLYCDDIGEARDVFQQILLENEWEETAACCFQPHVQSVFEDVSVSFSKKMANSSFYLCDCEYLVANIGGILVSSNQLKETRISELPENFVVISYTSQLTNDISEGLQYIKNRGAAIPSNITTLQHFDSSKKEADNFMNYGNVTKNLYLILIEDL